MSPLEILGVVLVAWIGLCVLTLAALLMHAARCSAREEEAEARFWRSMERAVANPDRAAARERWPWTVGL